MNKPLSESLPDIEVKQGDLSPYKSGNIGIDYVHRFDSGIPGPHVLINALTHGNEICGMVAATHLLDNNVRPLKGTLTVSFANVEAYNAFDPDRPFDNRQLVHNLNRIWSAEMLDSDEQSPELRRARELRPVVGEADHILDIHSTSSDVDPFWVYIPFERNSLLASSVAQPAIHLLLPGGLTTGTGLMQYAQHGTEDGPGAAVVVECGQHFKRAAADLATDVTLRFLAHYGLINHPEQIEATNAKEQPTETGAAQAHKSASPRRFKLLETHVVKSQDFTFSRPLVGLERFSKDEVIARNGDETIVAPCDECTVFMPTREPIVGREAVYLTLPV
ncbi:MAG: succinylglutamate desuccinylase/aspartoacylase family protein [Burkholderiaceae bacterium]